jgi:hypothetical protein
MDLPEKGVGCHRTGFEKDCRALVVDGRCKRWMQIQGANPNTGEQMNKLDVRGRLGAASADGNLAAGTAPGRRGDRVSSGMKTFTSNNVALQALQSLVKAQAELPPADPKLIEG